MSEKIGVFICDCGTNIAEVVDTPKLSEFAQKQDEVVEVKIHRLWCSEGGRDEMKQAIIDNKLTRVVVAACSPKQHEITFQKVLASAGLNPYLMQMANIREQVAWVTKDKDMATKKAVSQLNSAIRRVKVQKSLEKSEIECKTDFLVIGAGISGMSAALTLAQKNRKVYLVEREPWIGGKVVAYEDVFPKMECAPCMLEPKMDEVLHDEQISLMTNSEITNLKGFFGNFQVQIKTKARHVDIEKCIGCGACYDACPVSVKNRFNGDLSERHAIYSAFPGVLPNAPAIDCENCLRYKGEDCRKCEESCPFGAIDYTQKDEYKTVEVGAIVVATGFGVTKSEEIKNFAGISEVYDAYQFERIISSTGPTEGKIVTADNKAPEAIAFVHCAGSRDKRYKEYCSGVCCANTIKLAHLTKKKSPETKIYEIYSDWCLPGKNYQQFHDKCAADKVEYIRTDNANDIKAEKRSNKIILTAGGKTIEADMVVLSTAIVPNYGLDQFNALLGMNTDSDGFYSAEHEKISPAATANRGIYVAGCCTGPKDVPQSVAQAQAAAGMALSVIVPGEKLELEVATAKVINEICGGCHSCIGLCPYQAISFDAEKGVAAVNEILCRGCGVCVAACPAGAITNKHFTDEQIFSEIEGVLA